MPSANPLTIVGGGLAGLALAAAAARSGATVTLCEAGLLPRPRVCGEFISGLKPDVINKLGLAPHLRDAVVNRTTGWHAGGNLRWAADLPEPALGLSRPVLEERLLDDFTTAGGELRLNTRIPPPTGSNNPPGIIWSAGRRADATSPWIGLKIHCRNLHLRHDLEVHFSVGGYVGATRIEGGRVNVCGLFRVQPELRGPKEALLLSYLTACRLKSFAERFANGDPDPASVAAVSGLDFTRTWREPHRLSLGDHFGAIPPYTGHGMALALENAAAALDPLLAYSCGDLAWNEAVRTIRRAVAAQQSARLRYARWLHPFLLQPAGQKILLTLADRHLLPFQFFYRLTHGGAAFDTKTSPAALAAR